MLGVMNSVFVYQASNIIIFFPLQLSHAHILIQNNYYGSTEKLSSRK